jgi:phosphatidylinositol kinase/protein kinase (PI-3  family)
MSMHRFPPVFHEWFLETFPEPSVWLASRLTYGRTAAVMSMVGFILGCDVLVYLPHPGRSRVFSQPRRSTL